MWQIPHRYISYWPLNYSDIRKRPVLLTSYLFWYSGKTCCRLHDSCGVPQLLVGSCTNNETSTELNTWFSPIFWMRDGCCHRVGRALYQQHCPDNEATIVEDGLATLPIIAHVHHCCFFHPPPLLLGHPSIWYVDCPPQLLNWLFLRCRSKWEWGGQWCCQAITSSDGCLWGVRLNMPYKL